MQKIYYNKMNKLEIIDISGKKSLTQIKEEFGSMDYGTLEIDEAKEGYKIKGGKLEKYSLIEEKLQQEAEREAKRRELEKKLKTKLNFTDEQIQILKEAIKGGL